MDGLDLNKFIKYCLGYIQLTRQRAFAVQQKSAVEFPKKYFELSGLLNGEEDDALGETIALPLFYDLDPKEVKKEQRDEYEKQKMFAAKIEDIYNKYRNDPFTKQIAFSFGYFEIEIPIELEGEELESIENGESEPPPKQVKIDRYPLFSLIVKIEKEEKGKYVVYAVDQDIQVNLGVLEPVLGENLYYQLLDDVGKKEMDGLFSLPLKNIEIFTEVWHKIKTVLKHTKANFDEDSFKLEEMRIAIAPRANYFLAEDLQKLAKVDQDAMKDTSLCSWTSNEGISGTSEIPEEKDLYFPFLYDKYKLKVLSVINNKGAIVQGPPGTGKSETIANLLCHLAAHGKRVLFVSQKAQALKVVKDKLRKLDVKYLFGYIPNPSSAQLGEDDEADSISPQLAGLGAHIDSMGYKFYPRKAGIAQHGDGVSGNVSLAHPTALKAKLKNDFNQTIEVQRKAWKLDQEFKALALFDLPVGNPSAFTSNFSESNRKEVNHLKDVISSAIKTTQKYDESESKNGFDGLFGKINLREKSFATATYKIKEDIARSGFDGHAQMLRGINNFMRNMRLGGVRSELPREVRDYIDQELKKDISRNDACKLFEDLHVYFCHHENLINLEQAKKKLSATLEAIGLSDKEFGAIEEVIGKTGENVTDVKEKVLRTRVLRKELHELGKLGVNPNDVTENIKDAETERRDRVALYLQNIVNRNILEKLAQGPTIRQIVARLAKAFGKSKRAFRTFDKLRKDPDNFNAIMDLIPVWIMELDDASRIIPLEAGVFDYVILDEASQCNVAYTLPVMFRAKQALFVGDSEQMRDSTVMFKSNRSFDELARRYGVPEEMQIKASQATVQSVLDIATLRGFLPVPLRYHYRSPNELIGFSNQYFYKPKSKDLIALNNTYLTYKDTNRVMLVHEVKSDWSDEISDNANVAEASEILKLFKELRDDAKYARKSVGILTFFNAQAALLRKTFEDAGFKEDEDNFKISIIEGIQGDEKDIVIYSFVIRSPEQKKRYLPLTGEGGDIRGDINRGRVNVTFSRAKLQVHCFISMPITALPEGIWIKKYLEYVQKHGEVDFYATELRPFDSYFEEEFYALLKAGLKKDYQIRNQVESCGFKLDFAVTNTRTGKQIAIECDGPTHFEDELDEEYGIYVEDDEERQRVLESAGWTFYRVKYLDWLNESFDRKAVIKNLIKLMDD